MWLLLAKIGLGFIFVCTAMFLYFKENKRKEEVIALFYSFLPNDVRRLLKQNENLISIVMTKDFTDTENGILESAGMIESQDPQQMVNADDDGEDDQNQQIMIAKRNKARGRLDKTVDFNKFFIVFFALINTLYFVFLYFWSTAIFTEYHGLMRLSRFNNLQAFEISTSFNKFMTSLFLPLNDTSPTVTNIDENFRNFLLDRKMTMIVAHSNTGTSEQQVLSRIYLQTALQRVLSGQLPSDR